jgi:hypothetical protein
MRVKISKKGRRLLDNKELAARVSLYIQGHKRELQQSGTTYVNTNGISLRVVGSIPDTVNGETTSITNK